MTVDVIKTIVAEVQKDGKSLGTAFLVGSRHAATAFHVLRGHETVELRFAYWGAEGADPIDRIGKRVWFSVSNSDVAVLELLLPDGVASEELVPEHVKPLGLSAKEMVRGKWSSFGYPRGLPQGAVFNDEEIKDRDLRLPQLDYRAVYQLHSDAAADKLNGMSGAPCVVENEVVGVITHQAERFPEGVEPSLETFTQKQPVLNVVYAIPVTHFSGWGGVEIPPPHDPLTSWLKEIIQDRPAHGALVKEFGEKWFDVLGAMGRDDALERLSVLHREKASRDDLGRHEVDVCDGIRNVMHSIVAWHARSDLEDPDRLGDVQSETRLGPELHRAIQRKRAPVFESMIDLDDEPCGKYEIPLVEKGPSSLASAVEDHLAAKNPKFQGRSRELVDELVSSLRDRGHADYYLTVPLRDRKGHRPFSEEDVEAIQRLYPGIPVVQWCVRMFPNEGRLCVVIAETEVRQRQLLAKRERNS